mgnify:CR=1 FL=1
MSGKSIVVMSCDGNIHHDICYIYWYLYSKDVVLPINKVLSTIAWVLHEAMSAYSFFKSYKDIGNCVSAPVSSILQTPLVIGND